ncbi:MAG: replicative helicase [Actinomycetia bacterium]|nr:replicative helicase [Actinomycetes bacterium]
MTERQRRDGGRPADQPGRTPPHDTDSEEALLGAMLYQGEAITAAIETGLAAGDFYTPSNGQIFHAITTLHAAGEPADAITVATRLRADGILDGIGGPSALVRLQATPGLPAHAAKYARTILTTKGARSMLGQTAEIIEALYQGQVPNGALDTLNQLAERASRGWKNDSLNVTWGEPDIPPRPQPVIVNGFIRAGELAVAAAPRGIGKTFLTYNLAKLLADGHGKFMGTLEVLRPARVLLCQGELEEWQSYARWHALGGKPKNVAETWDAWRIRVQRHRRPAGDGGWDEWTSATIDPGLEQVIVDDGVEVLVIDPWRTFFAGTENSNDDAEIALSALTGLARRTGVAIVIIHHLTMKGADLTRVLDPEDLWRGASRLPDWASTRVTILPHYSPKAAEEAGLSRAIARRHVDVHFLRRAEPTDDFCAVLNGETGWWERWEGGEVGAGWNRGGKRAAGTGQPGGPGLPDVAEHYMWLVEACSRDGGDWHSLKEAAIALGKSGPAASKLLDMASRHGLLERYHRAGQQYGYRLPRVSPSELNFDDQPPPPDQPPDEAG